jgi:hypothetical protein
VIVYPFEAAISSINHVSFAELESLTKPLSERGITFLAFHRTHKNGESAGSKVIPGFFDFVFNVKEHSRKNEKASILKIIQSSDYLPEEIFFFSRTFGGERYVDFTLVDDLENMQELGNDEVKKSVKQKGTREAMIEFLKTTKKKKISRSEFYELVTKICGCSKDTFGNNLTRLGCGKNGLRLIDKANGRNWDEIVILKK